MKNEMNQNNSEQKTGRGYQIATWTLALLFVGALATIFWFSNEKNSHALQASELSTQLEKTNLTKQEMEAGLSSLQTDYEGQIRNNDTLQMTLEARVAEVKNLQYRIVAAKKQLAESQVNADQIRSRLTQLESLRVALEEDIVLLQAENGELKVTNEDIQNALVASEMEVDHLNNEIAIMMIENDRIQKRLYAIAPAGFKADNFKIVAEQKNNKITTKAKRADEVKVTFNIDDVPSELRGQREIYLVLTEFNGNEVGRILGRDVSVRSSDTPFKVSAADIETIQLSEQQTMTMSFKPTEDLNPGTYNVLVYADSGFLGSTGFQLR